MKELDINQINESSPYHVILDDTVLLYKFVKPGVEDYI